MRIFKYTAHAKKILSSKTIRLSSAHELNDPFELAPVVDLTRFSPKQCALFLRREDQIRHWFEKDGVPNGILDYSEYKKYFLATIPQRSKELLPKVPQNAEESRQKFAETFSSYWRLFCASTKRNSILMWSHYAREHTGAVIEFDTSENPFRALGQRFCLRVKYSDQKAAFPFDWSDEKEFMKTLLEVARRKSKDWEYEDEIRLVFPKQKSSFFPVSPSAIKSITLGSRCPDAEKDELLKIVRSDKLLGHVSIFQSKLSKTAFDLEFEELPRSV